MSERRFTDEEVKAIFAAATEEQASPAPSRPSSRGLTLTELQDIGREVGVPPEAISRAAFALDSRPEASIRRYFGLPIAVERTIRLPRRLTDDEWDRLVVQFREVFHAKGTLRSSGSFREWTNGNLQALLEPTETGHQLRLRTYKGDSRPLISIGVVFLGFFASTVVAGALRGRVANSLPGVIVLGLIGLGAVATATLRIFPWSKERARQFEGIAARLALPPVTGGRGEGE
jgi:hypothetical protein